MDVLEQFRIGYFSFCSNIDTSAKEIYLAYKDRRHIEECFDYLKNKALQQQHTNAAINISEAGLS